MPKGAILIFFLLLALIAVVYYVGFVSDSLGLAKGAQILGFTFTGRNAQGQFAGYPNSNASVYVPSF